MVWECHFFFAHKSNITNKYKSFFGVEEPDNREVDEDEQETTTIPASENAARFYFQLTYQLAKEDITKFDVIDRTNLYLCLNTASLIKDRIIQEQNDIKKMKIEIKN